MEVQEKRKKLNCQREGGTQREKKIKLSERGRYTKREEN